VETALCRGLGPSEDHRTERGAWFDSKDMPAGTTVRSRAARCRRRRSDSAPSKPTDGVITRRSRSGRPLGRPGLSGAPIRQRNHPVLGLPAWSTRPQTEKMETGATESGGAAFLEPVWGRSRRGADSSNRCRHGQITPGCEPRECPSAKRAVRRPERCERYLAVAVASDVSAPAGRPCRPRDARHTREAGDPRRAGDADQARPYSVVDDQRRSRRRAASLLRAHRARRSPRPRRLRGLPPLPLHLRAGSTRRASSAEASAAPLVA
jgi:hypothetical protein